jgi:hypothetical protein
VERRFLSPPREFKTLYGAESRQTTLENFFVVRKFGNPIVKRFTKPKKYRQSNIMRYLRKKK